MGKGAGVLSQDSFQFQSPAQLDRAGPFVLPAGRFIHTLKNGRQIEVEVLLHNVNENGQYLHIPEEWREKQSTSGIVRVSKEFFESREDVNPDILISRDGYCDGKTFTPLFNQSRSLALTAFDTEPVLDESERPVIDFEENFGEQGLSFERLQKFETPNATARQTYWYGYKIVEKNGRYIIAKSNRTQRIWNVILRCLLFMITLGYNYRHTPVNFVEAFNRTESVDRLLWDNDLSEIGTIGKEVQGLRDAYVARARAENPAYYKYILSTYLLYFSFLNEEFDFTSNDNAENRWHQMLSKLFSNFCQGQMTLDQLMQRAERIKILHSIYTMKIASLSPYKTGENINNILTDYLSNVDPIDEETLNTRMQEEMERRIERDRGVPKEFIEPNISGFLKNIRAKIPNFQSLQTVFQSAIFSIYVELSKQNVEQEKILQLLLTNFIPLFEKENFTPEILALLNNNTYSFGLGFVNTMKSLAINRASQEEIKDQMRCWNNLCARIIPIQALNEEQRILRLREEITKPEMQRLEYRFPDGEKEALYENLEESSYEVATQGFLHDYCMDGLRAVWIEGEIILRDKKIVWKMVPNDIGNQSSDEQLQPGFIRQIFSLDGQMIEEDDLIPLNPLDHILNIIVEDVRAYFLECEPLSSQIEQERYIAKIISSLRMDIHAPLLPRIVFNPFSNNFIITQIIELAEKCPTLSDVALISLIDSEPPRLLSPNQQQTNALIRHCAEPVKLVLSGDEASITHQGKRSTKTYYLFKGDHLPLFDDNMLPCIDTELIKFDWMRRSHPTIIRTIDIVPLL